MVILLFNILTFLYASEYPVNRIFSGVIAMNKRYKLCDYAAVLSRRPDAAAKIYGSDEHLEIIGRVSFFGIKCSTLVAAEIRGLPTGRQVFGFHIHEGESCTGNATDPFADVGTHYNPDNRAHPFHSGDMPPLFGNCGYAFSVFMTDRFSSNEIIGKTVIIHGGIDDFSTQPSGNAGSKIACGKIEKC